MLTIMNCFLGFMMNELPPCLKCGSKYTYEDGNLYICPECSYEWSQNEEMIEDKGLVVRDAHGNLLQDGDSVTVVKDIKVKGSSPIKVGTKIKEIRLVDGPDGHNIDCKIKGYGGIMLKSQLVNQPEPAKS